MCYCTPEVKTPCCGDKCHAFLGIWRDACAWHNKEKSMAKMTSDDKLIDAAYKEYRQSRSVDTYSESQSLLIALRMGMAVGRQGYIPVPRCETCAHWRLTRVDFGHCTELALGGLLDASTEEDVVMRKDFGCVQWRAKS